mmetsp:Transcript_9030/g.21469  ORF Transcript_9030/g.21469 Transcript_9030/m.21469 type:complete len:202 (-) Transcript_9030:1714-2319(-)
MSTSQEESSKDTEESTPTPEDDSHRFPTLPAFTVPVEVRSAPQYGPTEFGVFALEDIPANCRDFWIWTDRVKKIHHTELEDYIQSNFESTNIRQIRQFLRRGFVLPPPKDDYWNSNPTDAGSFMNHSSTPNCGQPYGTLRTIKKGEELVMDYSGNGNPKWYQDICHKYGILTGVEIGLREKQSNGQIQHASFDPPQGFPTY